MGDLPSKVGGILSKVGGFLVLMGVGSAILSLFDYEFKLLMWIDNWGTGVGWLIRIALAVVGAGLALAGLAMSRQPAGSTQA